MSAIAQRPRRPIPHQGGHLAGALVDIALLVVINLGPGWRTVPVLTDAARGVVVAVNMSLAVALVVFPFRFTGSDVDWTTVTRLGLISVIVLVAIALVVQLVRLVIAVRGSRTREVRR